MNVEPHELGPSWPVSEMEVLAAVERAQRHESRVYNNDIAKPLGFKPGSASTRRLRPQLESLHAAATDPDPAEVVLAREETAEMEALAREVTASLSRRPS